MPTFLDQTNRARALWLTCLASAFRTALACTIVALTTLYGPQSLRRQVTFPAFSYVTVILIAPDATLGDTLCGLWLGLCATVQSLGPAILSLWLIGPAQLSSSMTALAVGLGAFAVALPEFTHLLSKRIALGQNVLVYVTAYIKGGRTDGIMHPLHLAASTGVGVLACVLAFLVPFPRLASREVKQNSKLLAENASDRLKLFVNAFCAEDSTFALASISQAKSLAAMATKIFQAIKRHQKSMKWERLPRRFSKYVDSEDGLQGLEIPLRGMEMALAGCPSFPVGVVDGELKDGLLKLVEKHMILNLSTYCDSITVPTESNTENVRFLQTLQTIPPTHQDFPQIFFLFCIKLLNTNLSPTNSSVEDKLLLHQNEGSIISSCKQKIRFCFEEMWSYLAIKVSTKRLMAALKCSLSLGLAVFFGLMYSKEDGYWAGLPVAISLAAAREATFKVANVKAQGTVLGTIYGVFSCFLFQRFLPIRLFSLIPWFIFTSFLQRSQMYGQAGGISAVIGAVLILGRTNFGPPREFAIARIVETFIGLGCSIMVELALQPTRASSLAKIELSRALGTLCDCINSMSLQSSKALLEENQKRLKTHVDELGKLIGEAEVEPNFWFLPFHGACYGRMLRSFSKTLDLLILSAHAIEALEANSQALEASWKDTVHKMEGDLQLFKKIVESLLSCFKEITLTKSITVLDQESGMSHDLEKGKSQAPNIVRICGSEDEEMGKVMSCYLQHSKEVVDNIDVESEELKSQMVLCLSALGFCISSLIRETREIEEGIKELVQWENPSSHINLYEISCKIHALQK